MGRRPTRNLDLPKGMRARHRGKDVYYFYEPPTRPRKEIALGKDYVLAVKEWVIMQERSNVGDYVTLKHVADLYIKEVLHKKAPATQEINRRELANLLKVFNDPPMPIDDIEPVTVQQYLARRADAPYAANREKALLSHMFNFARSTGLTNKANPCAGIKGHKEPGRDVYIDDEVFAAVWECAEPGLRDAMDLAYLTAQRKSDVLKMTRDHVRSGEMSVKQGKTGAKLRLEVVGVFADVMHRINSRKVMGLGLVCDEFGRPLTKYMLRGAFDRARNMACEASAIGSECAGLPDISDAIRAFQFRDLRAKAGTDTEELRGMAAAKDQLGHSSEGMTAHYVRHRRGKLVKPTK